MMQSAIMICHMCRGPALKCSCGYVYKTYKGSDEKHVMGAICRSCIESIEKWKADHKSAITEQQEDRDMSKRHEQETEQERKFTLDELMQICRSSMIVTGVAAWAVGFVVGVLLMATIGAWS